MSGQAGGRRRHRVELRIIGPADGCASAIAALGLAAPFEVVEARGPYPRRRRPRRPDGGRYELHYVDADVDDMGELRGRLVAVTQLEALIREQVLHAVEDLTRPDAVTLLYRLAYELQQAHERVTSTPAEGRDEAARAIMAVRPSIARQSRTVQP